MRIGPTLLKACALGNKNACNAAKKVYALYAGSVISFSEAVKVKDHPNKLPFQGILLVCDEPSNKPPHGSEGHRILVRSSVAKQLLATLPGMAINYDTGDLDSHATRHKVGVITKAWMEGKNVKVAGYIWIKDFPEAAKDLRNRNDLGMSMELADVWVDDEKSAVWDLSKFTFTGATILKKNAAAYQKTSLAAQSLAAAARAAAVGEEGEKVMKHDEKKKKKVAAAARTSSGDMALVTQAITASMTNGLREFGANLVSEIKASNERVMEGFEEMRNLHLIQASADDDEDEEIVLNADADESESETEERHVRAVKHEEEEDDDEEDDDMEAEQDDASASDSSSSDASATEMDALADLEIDPPEESTGEVNKKLGGKNKGSKTKVQTPPTQGEHMPGNIAKGRLHSRASSRSVEAAAVLVQQTRRENKQLRKQMVTLKAAADKKIGKLHTRIESMDAQLEEFANREDRRSAPSRDLVVIAGKAGYNLGEIKAAGQKFTIDAVDHMISAAASSGMALPIEQRIALKNKFLEQGLMEDDYTTQGGR